MAKFTATRLRDVEPTGAHAGGREVEGVAWSRRVSPPGHPMWMVVVQLDDGGEIRWRGPHSDDGVYVVAGALDVDGRRCPSDGAVVVESDAVATARAVGPTRVVHVGSVDDAPPADGLYGPPAREGHGVHVVGDRGWYVSGDRERVQARWFADSTCPTCRLSMFHVRRVEAGVKDIPHSHTQDELIYVLEGSVVMGAFEFGPDTCLAIPAGVRYSVTSGSQGYAFLNARRDVSVQHYGTVKEPELEGGLARGGEIVADLR